MDTSKISVDLPAGRVVYDTFADLETAVSAIYEQVRAGKSTARLAEGEALENRLSLG